MCHIVIALTNNGENKAIDLKTMFSYFIVFFLGGDPLACTIPCKWNNDTFSVVLEIQSESSKATSDAEPCSLRDLLHELEENNIIDVSLHSHTVERPGPSEETTSGS